MNAKLARRLAELRACENVAELRVVSLDECGNRALVLLVPRSFSGVSTDTGWQQPNEPFLLWIDPAALLGEHALH